MNSHRDLEDRVVDALLKQGWEVGKQVQSPPGADYSTWIDIVASKGKQKLYIEVKTGKRLGVSDFLSALPFARLAGEKGEKRRTFVVTEGQIPSYVQEKAKGLGVEVVSFPQLQDAVGPAS